MPPKSSLTADAAPRRSTRRTKRPADTDLEEDEPAAPTKQPKKAAASKSQRGAPGQKQSGKHARGRKGKAHDDGPPDDTPASASKASKTSKTAKNTKADKPQADQQSKSAVKDAKQEQGSPSAESTLSTQAANKPTAASKSGQPGPSDEQQLAAAADTACPKAHSTTVAGDADVMLNQTNIGANNNKFYRMQLLQEGPSDHWLWTRWGRVGDKGQSQLQGPFDADTGLKEFEKKFKSKVGAAFDDKDEARKVRSGKYSLVDLDSFSSPPVSPGASKPKTKPKSAPGLLESKLEAPTKDFMELIFSNIMFQEAMQEFDIDTERLPLGTLSKDQVQRGYDVLERLRSALNGSGDSLERLSSEFYQVIPHNFGRQRPPIIRSQKMVEDKIRMCDVLSDIEVAQDLLELKPDEEEEPLERQPHPADEKYATLQADLNVIQPSEEEYKIVRKFAEATGSGQQLMNVWRVNRRSEATKFQQHSKLDNRRLLWHGTNIAVVAAILKAGLRIMPHACGRVGRGLYLANEHSKSAAYVTCGRKGKDLIGVMFLAEAALGKEHHIVRDDPSLTKAPAGFHSVVAKGRTESDPAQDAHVDLDGNAVHVAQSKPVQVPECSNSNFMQSEYLLYQESQARIRYMLTMKFSHAGCWH
ncbi:Poly [ADP-ribose] polymerase 3 [Trebouxia sp. C0009 RCD-2024]